MKTKYTVFDIKTRTVSTGNYRLAHARFYNVYLPLSDSKLNEESAVFKFGLTGIVEVLWENLLIQNSLIAFRGKHCVEVGLQTAMYMTVIRYRVIFHAYDL